MTQYPVADLGTLDAPLIICGGAYSNLEALTALFDIADKRGIPSDHVIHTGDVVAYAADPVATSDLLREHGAPCIMGNVEESLGAGFSTCGCGFDEGTQCDVMAARWYAYADELVGDDLRMWMAQMPCHITFEMTGRTVRVVHGGVTVINRFLYPSTSPEEFEAELDNAEADIVIAGHSGLPFTRLLGRRIWHNSGALGMPANDGTTRVWYSTLTPVGGQIQIEHHALEYDYAAARQKMLDAGLPHGYADALSTGLWPSLDALPETERRRTGEPLAFAA